MLLMSGWCFEEGIVVVVCHADDADDADDAGVDADDAGVIVVC